MSFQTTVAQLQGFSVPGEIFQDVAWTCLTYTLESGAQPNVVGSTAYTITSQGIVQAGNGGTLGFAGFLAIPKSYALNGLDGALSPTLELANFTQAEIISHGMLVVSLPAAASIGDFIIYDNTTGAISSIPPSNTIPDGFSFANATVSQFTQSISGDGLAVILIDAGNSASSNLTAFTYENAYWAAANGSDTNDGLSIDRPFQTIDAFIAAVAALTDPTVFTVLNVPDAASFTASASGYTFPTGSNILINAPSSFINTTGTIGLLRGTGGSLKIVCAGLSAAGQRLITFGGDGTIVIDAITMAGNLNNDSTTGCNIQVTAQFLNGNVTSGVDKNTILRIDSIAGTVTETSSSAASYKMGLFCRSVSGNIASTNGSIYGQVFDCGGTVSCVIQGIFDGVLINIA